MAAHGEEQTADTLHFARGLFQVRETRYLVDGWDTERGVELWYGNGADIDGRILVDLSWSAGGGWRFAANSDTRGGLPTEEVPHLADALEALARVVRAL